MTANQENATTYETDTLLTIKQLADDVPALSEGGLRWDIFNAKVNGLEESGAMARRGSRVYLWRNRYLEWLSGGCV